LEQGVAGTMHFEPGDVSFCDTRDHCRTRPRQEVSDVDRRSYVDWGFRCRLRPSRLDINKTEARREKGAWRLSLGDGHIARRAAGQ
jgi:hypothetical protein